MANGVKERLVVIDDERYICDLIVESLMAERFSVTPFTDPIQATEHLRQHSVDLVLTDLVMGACSGVAVLEETLANHPDAIVILMTAHPTVETAIAVLKKGAYDFLVKPFKLEVLKATIKRGLAHQKLVRENVTLKSQVEFLRTSSALTTGVDIDRYLRMLVKTCRTELAATAAAIIEINPAKSETIRQVYESDDPSHTSTVLDDSHLLRFSYTKSPQAHVTTEQVTRGEQKVVRTFISSPIFVRRTLHGIINVLVQGRFETIFPAQMNVLSMLTTSAASAISNQKLHQDLQTSLLQAVRALANAIEARDQYTAGHTDRVTKLAEVMAGCMGWDRARLHDMIMGCTLHDIGKIGVPDSILNKAARLTEEERLMMVNHPLVGMRIISGIDLLKPSIPYIISHHERYDGTGYPKGLKGEEIPIEGRLLAVVDTFDAILSDRPYRKGASLATAIKELNDNKGRQFDPKLVDLFLQLLRAGRISFMDLYNRQEDLSCLDELMVNEKVPA